MAPELEWQPLKERLRSVAEKAADLARPLHMEHEARLAGLLHDLGKYAERFQQRLRNSRIHGVNHWAAGAVESIGLVSYAVDGHHHGLRSFSDLRDTLTRSKHSDVWQEMTGCSESPAELLARLTAGGCECGTFVWRLRSHHQP